LIQLTDNTLDLLKAFLKEKGSSSFFLITDVLVFSLYGETLWLALQKEGFKGAYFIAPDKEAAKVLAVAENVWHALEVASCDKESVIISLGGGAISDLSGFIASTFLRGVAFISIPTTLLAQVDAAIGGKNGLNSSFGKNRIGTIYSPCLIIINALYLSSLSHRLFCSGLAEVIKYGVIHDAPFFEYLEENISRILDREPEVLKTMVLRSIAIKNALVASGTRDLLNYGHTVGHALEALQNFSLLHGEAVAIGMQMEAILSQRLGKLVSQAVDRQKNLLLKAHLPTDIPQENLFSSLIPLILKDKKNIRDNVVFILPEEIGKASLFSLDTAFVCNIFAKTTI
jgi:3-dehydroquinate synthase